jgi:leukotriene-A4 hydrolase
VTSAWSTQEWVHFIDNMPETLTPEQLKQLDSAYKFTGTPNGEIAQRWYPLTVRSGYTEARPAIAEFLQHIGRRKLIMPTYEALVKTTDGLAFARDVFAKAKPGYHPITTASVEATIAQAKPEAATTTPASDAAAAEDKPIADDAQKSGTHTDGTSGVAGPTDTK